MRPLLAIVGASTLAAAAAIAITLPRTQPEAQTPAPATTPFVYATADPNVTARVDVGGAFGRVTLDDRVDRTRRSVSGLALPIDGAAVPTDPELLPNAPRDFRAGWHEGIDFPAPAGTPVRAVAPGMVVRIDRDFTDWTRDEEEAALAAAVDIGYTPSATLDRIRGRQVWIDHGNGIVSRYAHLSGVAALSVGDAVAAGTLVGYVGSTGFPEGGPHLHLEVRIGTSYLGDGLEGDALIGAVTRAFE